MYELQYKKKAIKALAKINDPYYTAIIETIDSLAQDARPFGYKKLTGRNGYRIIYDIFETNLIIEIVNVGVRGAIYED
jgi:mRNA interferase RelE/StbE